MTGNGRKLIIFKFWQLCRSEHHIIEHQQRRRDFGIIVRIAGVHIEKKLPERSFKPRQILPQNYKTRTRKLRCGFKVHLAERFAKNEVLLWRETFKFYFSFWRISVHLDVALLIFAAGHLVEWQIWNLPQEFIEIFSSLFLLLLQFRNRRFTVGNLRHQFFDVRFVFISFGLTNCFRCRISLCLPGLKNTDERASVVVDRNQILRRIISSFLVIEIAPAKCLIKGLSVLTYPTNVVHRCLLKTWMPGTSPGMTNQQPERYALFIPRAW